MSQALKCDRCKVCFDPWTTDGEFVTIREMTFQNRENWKNHEVSYRDEEFHMCPQCAKLFSVFMGCKSDFELFSGIELFANGYSFTDPLTKERRFSYFNKKE